MLLLLLLAFMIMLLVLASATSEGDLLSPSVVMTAMFSVSIAFAWFMQDEWIWVDYTTRMAVVLAAGVTAFVAGEMSVRHLFFRRQSRKASPAPEADGPRPARRLLSIASWKIAAISVLGMLLIAWQYREVSRLAVLGGYSGAGNMLTYYRVQVSFTLSDEALNPILVQGLRFIEVCAYISAFVFVNNVLVWRQRLRPNLQYLLPVALFVTKNLLNSDRGRVLLLVMFAVVVTFYLSWQARSWRRPKVGPLVFRAILLSTTAMIAFYYLADVVGRTSQATRTAFDYFGVYLGGSIGNFAQFVEDPLPPNAYFGEETFLNVHGFLNSLGLTDFRRLSQLEFRYMEPGTRGNIYTFFRRPLQDFGLEGMLLVSFAVAAFFTWYVIRFIRDREVGSYSDRAILVYGYLFFLIATSSVQNRLFLYASVSAITIVVGLLIMYRLLVDVQTEDRRADMSTAGARQSRSAVSRKRN